MQGLLSEAAFLRLLSLERKRSERSKQPFVLMVIERSAPVSNDTGILRRLTSSLFASIRETDVAGWYSGPSLGVIFAELGTGTRATVIDALKTRMTAALRSALDQQELDHVRLLFHWFPEEWKERREGSALDGAVYPDVTERDERRKLPLAMKRAVDLVASLALVVVLGPVLAAIAIAIRLTSPGPIIFRQERLGQHGRTFTLYKFRSMYAKCDPRLHVEYVKRFIAGTAEAHADAGTNGVVYKLTRDPRVTPVGAFLRRTSLDELPQLFNVLKGEMSLVGPRPPIAYELEAYDLWHRRRVLEAKPGITGLWQVTGRSRMRFDDMVRLDLEYAKAWSLWLDLKILLRTARVVLSGAGAH
jgi:exopolysaccharide biosynthesis polyprenyl glycosylphosphotransferase